MSSGKLVAIQPAILQRAWTFTPMSKPQTTLNTTALDSLPALPQVKCLNRIISRLWERDDVVALWLGGSFARGEADSYSDLDLRVAISSESLSAWSSADLTTLTGETVVGGSSLVWEGTILRHMVLAGGIILDLLVQSAEKDPPQDFTIVLGCREEAFGTLLDQARLPPSIPAAQADPAALRQAVVDFWVGSHKHARMLHRGLDLLVLIGLSLEQSVLMRLWYVSATGHDQVRQRETIHTLTPTVKTVTEAMGAHCLETLGTPRGSRADILRAIEANRNEASRVGRHIADRLGFEYPETLEQTVRETWAQFKRDVDNI